MGVLKDQVRTLNQARNSPCKSLLARHNYVFVFSSARGHYERVCQFWEVEEVEVEVQLYFLYERVCVCLSA